MTLPRKRYVRGFQPGVCRVFLGILSYRVCIFCRVDSKWPTKPRGDVHSCVWRFTKSYINNPNGRKNKIFTQWKFIHNNSKIMTMLCYICENSIFSVSIYTSWSCLLQGNASDKGEKPCRTPTLSIDSSPYQSTIFYNNLQYLPCISQFESWSSETKHKNYFTLFETTCICTKIDEQAIPANFNMQVKLHLFQAI